MRRHLAANLDEDDEPEHLIVIRPEVYGSLRLLVLDSLATGLSVIFDTDVQSGHLSEPPEIGVLNRKIPNPAFFTLQFHEQDPGTHRYRTIYRMLGGRVMKGMEISDKVGVAAVIN